MSTGRAIGVVGRSPDVRRRSVPLAAVLALALALGGLSTPHAGLAAEDELFVLPTGRGDPIRLLEAGQERLQAGARSAGLALLRDGVAAAVARDDVDTATQINQAIESAAAAYPGWVDEALIRIEQLDPGQEAAYGSFERAIESARANAAGNRMDAAVDAAERALATAERTFGRGHALTLLALEEVAVTEFRAGDIGAAEANVRRAVDQAEAALGYGHPQTQRFRGLLADVLESGGDLEAALEVRDTIDENWSKGAPGLGTGHPDALTARLAMLRTLDAVGRYQEATRLARATCAAHRDLYGGLHPQTAGCFMQLGTALGREGNLSEALAALQAAEAIAARVQVPQAPLRLQAIAAQVEVLRRLADHDAARTLLDRGLALADGLSREHPDRLELDAANARLLEDTGEFGAALRIIDRVYQARARSLGADDPATLTALNTRAGVRMRLGDLAAAQRDYGAAYDAYLAIFGETDAATIAVMNNLGVVLEKQGLYDEAEPLLRSALQLAEDNLGTAHPTTLRNMNNLALLHEGQGSFQRAEPLYDLSLQILSADLGPAHPDTASVRNNLAYLYMMQGDHGRAAEAFARIHADLADALGSDHQTTLKAQNNLGRALRAGGDLAAAAAAIEAARDGRREALGRMHMDTLRSELDLGILMTLLGDLRDAERQLERTLRNLEKVLGPQHPYSFEALNALADAQQAQGELDDAFETRQEGFRRRTAFFERMLWATNENAREGYLRLNRPELDAYLQLIIARGGPEAGRHLLDVSLQRKGLLLKISSEIQRIGALSDDPEVRALTEQLVEQRKALAAVTLSGPVAGDAQAHLDRIARLESDVARLEGELARQSMLYRHAASEYQVDDVLDALPDGAGLVDYFVYAGADGRSLAAAVARSDGGDATVELVDFGPIDEIEGAIREFREIIQDPIADDVEVTEIGQYAHGLIWAPVAAHLPPDGPVYLIPDGMLNVLPFDALVDAEGEFLVSTTELRLLSSSRDLIPQDLPAAGNAFLVLAGPDYETEDAAGEQVLAEVRGARARRSAAVRALETPTAATDDAAVADAAPTAGGTRGGSRGARGARLDLLRSVDLSGLNTRSAARMASLRAAAAGLRGLQFAPLPGAEEEGRLISATAADSDRGNQLYLRGDAQESLLSQLETPPAVLHVATHGFFLEADEELRERLQATQRSIDIQIPPPGDNPLLRAGLAFAGINSNAEFLGEIDTSNDGVLTALEVLSLDFTGTRLAVLSACETGLGAVHEGEGIYGLRRAFQEAGVANVVTSLWEVSDEGTQALMTAMYSRLLDGVPPREALRQAQRELMADERWGYPYIWAAFTLVGSS